jgi:hypothetical protein
MHEMTRVFEQQHVHSRTLGGILPRGEVVVGRGDGNRGQGQESDVVELHGERRQRAIAIAIAMQQITSVEKKKKRAQRGGFVLKGQTAGKRIVDGAAS